MATGSDTGAPQEIARKLLVPAVVGIAGSALGLLLTQKRNVGEAAPKIRDAVSDLPRPHVPDTGIGDIAGDLKEKVESVLGKEPSSSTGGGSQRGRDELERRRSEREARRTQRRRARR